MSCHVEHTTFAGYPTTLIWCGEDDPPPQPCRTCHAPDAEFLCDWPTLKPTLVRTEELKVGDSWVMQQSGKHGKIVEILDLDGFGRRTDGDFYQREFWVRVPGHPKPYPYRRVNGSSHLTLRPGTCDAPCCESHAREVDDDKHYCQEHWTSWEAA